MKTGVARSLIRAQELSRATHRGAFDVGRCEGRVRDASSSALTVVVARPALPPLPRVRGIALEARAERAIRCEISTDTM